MGHWLALPNDLFIRKDSIKGFKHSKGYINNKYKVTIVDNVRTWECMMTPEEYDKFKLDVLDKVEITPEVKAYLKKKIGEEELVTTPPETKALKIGDNKVPIIAMVDTGTEASYAKELDDELKILLDKFKTVLEQTKEKQ